MEIEHKKNTAKYLPVPMVSTANPETFLTGETVTDTAYYKDGAGAWTSLAITDTFTEIGTTGIYEIDLTAAELNHDQVLIKLTSTNCADSMVLFQMYTNDVDDLATAANLTTVDTVVDGIQADLDNGTDGLGALKALIDTIDTVVDSILSDTGTDGVVISAATANQIADALLNRDMSAVSDTTARSPLNALRLLRNKYSVSGTTLTVTKENDVDSAWTATLTTDAAASPVTGSDPTT